MSLKNNLEDSSKKLKNNLAQIIKVFLNSASQNPRKVVAIILLSNIQLVARKDLLMRKLEKVESL